MTPLTVDEVILQYLSTSPHVMTPDMRSRFDSVDRNKTWREKCLCRQIMEELNLLRAVTAREWFRVQLSSYQLKRLFLGYDPTQDFSRYYSENTYRIDVASRNLLEWSHVTGPRKIHRDQVLECSRSIESHKLAGVILCVSRWCINRKLKGFDGNHRLIAYFTRHRRMDPFECIIGLNRTFLMNLAQRALLGFPFKEKLIRALSFHLKQNVTRFICLLRGGQHYQPILKDRRTWTRLTQSGNGETLSLDKRIAWVGERPCVDRAVMIHGDLVRNNLMESFRRASLLDIGCNIGFFCHYFQRLGFQTTGIDNSSHNRHQRFSMASAIEVARKQNQRYGLSARFCDVDAVEFLLTCRERYDVVLLLSVFHHFFIGYPVDCSHDDFMCSARDFMRLAAWATGRVLYIEYDDSIAELTTSELIEFLKHETGFVDVKVIGRSSDYERPILRCLRAYAEVTDSHAREPVEPERIGRKLVATRDCRIP